MSDFEIHPSKVNPLILLFGALALAVSIGFGLTVLPKAIYMFQEYPDTPIGYQVLISLAVFVTTMWLIFIVVAVATLGRRIVVENNLVYFKRRSKLGFGKWTIDKIIDFSQISSVKDRQKSSFVSTGSTLIPVVFSWLIFEGENGEKQELYMNGWDGAALKNLFYYLRGKFPNVKFNTHIFKDSPEKLSGIDAYLKK